MEHDADAARSMGHAGNPLDTPLSSATRFTIEIVAWVAGPWAAAELTGSNWSIAPAAIVLIGLPALFNTPGDKKSDVVATPGPIRFGIEMLLLASAVGGSWIVWPPWATVVVSVIGVAMLVAGVPRYRWLLRQTGDA